MKKQAKPDFSRPLKADRVPKLGCHEKLVAEEKERRALAQRLRLPAIHHLGGNLHILAWRGGGLKITGTMQIDFTQVSVVSLEEFTTKAEFPIERYFLSQRQAQSAETEDVDIIENGVVDLGEMLTETLALELELYPRKPGEVFDDLLESVEPNKVSLFGKLKPGK